MKPKGVPLLKYLRIGVGKRLSKLGERFGWHWLTYNPLHFRFFHDQAKVDAPPVIQCLVEVFPNAQRWIDVGCGTGLFSHELVGHNKTVVAVEHSPTGRRFASRAGIDCRPFDLTLAPPAATSNDFDLAISFEVAEHLPPALGEKLVEFCIGSAKTVVFTAAQPGQGGTGHINEQPRGYWKERFEKAGAIFDADATRRLESLFAERNVNGFWFAKNVQVFHRCPS